MKNFIPKNKIDFKNQSVFKNLELQAYDGTLDIKDFPSPEYKYFDMLRKIYYEFKFNGLDKDTAETYKKVIFDEYTKSIEEFEEAKNVNQFHLDNIRRCKSLRTGINKAKTWKGKAIPALELIEILTSETGFAKSNML